MNGAPEVWDVTTVLMRSSSFWTQTVPLFAAAVALLAAGFWLISARFFKHSPARLRALVRNDAGSAEAMDFVLTFPIVMFVAFMFIQLLLGAHASLVVHYAAYSAARAARTAFFDVTVSDILILRGKQIAGVDENLQLNLGGSEDRARRLADSAARIALMSAVPSTIRNNAIPGGAGAIMYKSVGRFSFNRAAIRKKAAYAFTAGNAHVEVKVVDKYEAFAFGAGLQGKRIDALPVRAHVEFFYPLTMPAVARIFGTNGKYKMTAEVTLL